MKKYFDTKFILSIVFTLSILVALALSYKIDRNLFVVEEVAQTIETKEVIINEQIIDNVEIKYKWQIAIPKINLVAPIEEGSDVNTLRSNVGHISGTGLSSGNVALAGHTNTANYNGTFYFDKINELELGDRVYYRINNQDYIFKVKDIKVVNENDLSVLNETPETELTLITCITGEQSNRLVIICSQDTEAEI